MSQVAWGLVCYQMHLILITWIVKSCAQKSKSCVESEARLWMTCFSAIILLVACWACMRSKRETSQVLIPEYNETKMLTSKCTFLKNTNSMKTLSSIAVHWECKLYPFFNEKASSGSFKFKANQTLSVIENITPETASCARRSRTRTIKKYQTKCEQDPQSVNILNWSKKKCAP